MQPNHYIIRGGVEGRDRLRLLSRLMRPTTLALLERAGLKAGMTCLEVGSGGGDLAFDMAQIVGPSGMVLGTDIDQTKIQIATDEAEAQGMANVEFRLADITTDTPKQKFDLVHCRFVLTHLPKPELALLNMMQALRPGGIIVIEDIDSTGYFCYPDCPALWRYVSLYTQTVQRRGADPNIGPRLPSQLADTGFQEIQMNVVQPTMAEVKLLLAITMENIQDAVIAEDLATQGEIDQIVGELYEFASNPAYIGSGPRVIEAWGSTS